jgi:hypothetical protein
MCIYIIKIRIHTCVYIIDQFERNLLIIHVHASNRNRKKNIYSYVSNLEEEKKRWSS